LRDVDNAFCTRVGNDDVVNRNRHRNLSSKCAGGCKAQSAINHPLAIGYRPTDVVLRLLKIGENWLQFAKIGDQQGKIVAPWRNLAGSALKTGK
jgi:hypothetical protein